MGGWVRYEVKIAQVDIRLKGQKIKKGKREEGKRSENQTK